jgi:hypothetical protein
MERQRLTVRFLRKILAPNTIIVYYIATSQPILLLGICASTNVCGSLAYRVPRFHTPRLLPRLFSMYCRPRVGHFFFFYSLLIFNHLHHEGRIPRLNQLLLTTHVQFEFKSLHRQNKSHFTTECNEEYRCESLT